MSSTISNVTTSAPPVNAEHNADGAKEATQARQEAEAARDKKAKAQQKQAELAAHGAKDTLAPKMLAPGALADVKAAFAQLQSLGTEDALPLLQPWASLDAASERPASAAAHVLSATLPALENTPANAMTLLSRDEWRSGLTVLSGEAAVADDAPNPHADHFAAVIRTGIETLDGAPVSTTKQLSPPMAVFVATMTEAIRPLFAAQVTQASLGLKKTKLDAKDKARLAKDETGEVAERLLGVSPIAIPSPQFLRVERAARDAGNSEMDVSELAQIVMMECAKDSAQDLRSLLKDMQANNEKKKRARGIMDARKKSRAAVAAELRAQYDNRTRLEKGNNLRIVPDLTSFDAFCQAQMIVELSDPQVDEFGYPSAAISYSVSKNTVYFPQGKDEVPGDDGAPIAQGIIDQAGKLNVSPQKLQALQIMWDKDTHLQKIFNGDMHYWLIASTDVGGIGLAYDPIAGNQDIKITQYLMRIGNLESDLMEKFNISSETVKSLQSKWTQVAPALKATFGGKLDAWLEAAQPAGLGLKASSLTAQDGDANQRLSGFDGWMKYLEELSRTGLSDANLQFVNDVLKQANDPKPTLDALLAQMGCAVPATGPGSNNQAVDDWAAGRKEAIGESKKELKLPFELKPIELKDSLDLKKLFEHGHDDLNERNVANDWGRRAFFDELVTKCLSTEQREKLYTAINVLRHWENRFSDAVADKSDGNKATAQIHIDNQLAVFEDIIDDFHAPETSSAGEITQADILRLLAAQLSWSKGVDTIARTPSRSRTLHAEYDKLIDNYLKRADASIAAFNAKYLTPPPPPAFASAAAAIGTKAAPNGYPNRPGYAPLTLGTSKPPLGPPSEAQQAVIDALKKPVDHTIKQPGHEGVDGKELTLAMMDADIESWQSQIDTLGDTGQELALRMQMYQERYAKFFELLSNLMKSISDLDKSIIGNLK